MENLGGFRGIAASARAVLLSRGGWERGECHVGSKVTASHLDRLILMASAAGSNPGGGAQQEHRRRNRVAPRRSPPSSGTVGHPRLHLTAAELHGRTGLDGHGRGSEKGDHEPAGEQPARRRFHRC